MQVASFTTSATSAFVQGHAPRKATGCGALKSAVARTVRAVTVRAEAPATSGIEKSGPNMKALKEIQEIMEILPHRCVKTSHHCHQYLDPSKDGREAICELRQCL